LVCRLLSAWSLVGPAVLLCASQVAPAEGPPTAPATAPALSVSEMPDPDSLRAFDRPGDDGSGILVVWGKPKNEPNEARYVVEVATKPADFESGKFKTVIVKPSEQALASAKPEYFGFGRQTKETYFAQISPAGLFRPPPAPDLTAERLKELADSEVICAEQLARAQEALMSVNALDDAMTAVSEAQEALANEDSPTKARIALREARLALPKVAGASKVESALTEALRSLGKDEGAMRKSQADLAEACGALGNGASADSAKVVLAKAQTSLAVAVVASTAQKALRDAMVALSEAQDGWADAGEALTHAKDALTKAQGAIADEPALAKPQAALTKAHGALSEAPGRLSKADQGDLRWFGCLTAYLKRLDKDAREEKAAEVNRQPLFFRLAVRVGDGAPTYVSRDGRPVVLSTRAEPNWFKAAKLNNLVFSLVFCAIVFVFIQIAKRRPGLFIRKIAGLDAMDEAIGRATEMDRPVFFVHGLGGMGGLPTIAAVNILARVAHRTVQHDTRIRVMNIDPIVTAVSLEVVQQAYTEAGRPDAYNPDDVSLVANDQFPYAAAVSGIMVRDQPGAVFMLGYFAAESLLLAETGASTGAIQVAGTDSYTQLPFFITTCDYTLIGEELYAASAYLSREPRLLGSLRGQDVGKAFLMTALVLVSVVLTVTKALGADWSWLRNLLRAVE
jgi:hypothetical protein